MRTSSSIRSWHSVFTCCILTIRYCFYVIKSDTPHACITKSAYNIQSVCCVSLFLKYILLHIIRLNISNNRACVKHGCLRCYNCVRFCRARSTPTSTGEHYRHNDDSESSFPSLDWTSYPEHFPFPTCILAAVTSLFQLPWL